MQHLAYCLFEITDINLLIGQLSFTCFILSSIDSFIFAYLFVHLSIPPVFSLLFYPLTSFLLSLFIHLFIYLFENNKRKLSKQ